MNNIIRPALLTDAGAIAETHTVCWAESFQKILPNSYFEDMISQKSLIRRTYSWSEQIRRGKLLTGQEVIILVLEKQGKIVGFISGGDPRDHPGFDKEVMTLFLLRSYHGKGLGKLLLKRFIFEMRIVGCTSLALWVLANNPTRLWYKRQGGQECGSKKVYMGSREVEEIRIAWDI